MKVLYFLVNKIRKISKDFSRKKCFREYSDIHRVVILFDLEHAEDVKDFAKTLTFAGKEVFAFSYNPIPKNVVPVLPRNFTVLSRKQLSFNGFPQHQWLENYKSKLPDTLVDLTVKPHPVMQYLSIISEASYRVGFHRDEKTFDDLLLEYDPNQSFVFLTSQLHFYMKSIRSK
ncbi:MAG TPA: hypothetical protein VFP20_01130 [Bacteroidales bacterium]|nr:hypothetical protein [Bacteroidales bacterium]